MNIVKLKDTEATITEVGPFCLICFTESSKLSHFQDDVRDSLISVLGREQLVQENRYSPYFYGLGKQSFVLEY
jgi:hypothetical protein